MKWKFYFPHCIDQFFSWISSSASSNRRSISQRNKNAWNIFTVEENGYTAKLAEVELPKIIIFLSFLLWAKDTYFTLTDCNVLRSSSEPTKEVTSSHIFALLISDKRIHIFTFVPPYVLVIYIFFPCW